VASSGVRAPSRDLLRSSPPTALPAGPEGARTSIAPGEPGRVLVLADAEDGRWRATVDGKALSPDRAWGWAQAFAVPAGGGDLVLSYSQTSRHAALTVQVVLVIVVAVLSAPGARRRRGLEDDVDEDEVGSSQTGPRRTAVTA
jgi:hypothetical protein